MDQHIISAWLLRAFARQAAAGRVLQVYDKASDSYGEVTVDDFLAETDAHSSDVERDISKVETQAAQAALRLAKRAKRLTGGLYAIVGSGDRPASEGPALSDVGDFGGTRLFVSMHQLPSPSDADRLALATFAGLMYARAPKLEAAMIEWGRTYEATAQAVLDRLLPGMKTGLSADVSERRARMVTNARNIGDQLVSANWWIARAGAREALVLGDSPVATTVSLGHDDSWRAILADETYVVALPLGPSIALIMAPQRLIPISGIDNPDQVVAAVNRLIWRSADRYVIARDRTELEAALGEGDADLRRANIPVSYDRERAVGEAMGQVTAVVAEVHWLQVEGRWQRWDGCCLTFGFHPFVAEGPGAVGQRRTQRAPRYRKG